MQIHIFIYFNYAWRTWCFIWRTGCFVWHTWCFGWRTWCFGWRNWCLWHWDVDLLHLDFGMVQLIFSKNVQICVSFSKLTFLKAVHLAFSVEKGTPAWKRYATAGSGGSDNYQAWPSSGVFGVFICGTFLIKRDDRVQFFRVKVCRCAGCQRFLLASSISSPAHHTDH